MEQFVTDASDCLDAERLNNWSLLFRLCWKRTFRLFALKGYGELRYLPLG